MHVIPERTELYFAWDNDNFYLAAKCYDKNIVATGDSDQLCHYQLGDLIELFLKPLNHSWYWELYATPASKKTTFFFQNRLRRGETNITVNLRVASSVHGTLNHWDSGDKYWITEMAISRKALKVHGVEFSPDVAWSILVGRYDLNDFLRIRWLESFPLLTQASFHCSREYAILKLVKK